ncbi:hypothetical protein ACIGXM_24885 [Kitasatospora sp. NPDC052896]|uniref:hypothetical protein n=1 Tax=Kitasatospora sp. NPDC052896 TaxID=3364061 RepID=UPI0037CA9C30
MAGRHRRPPEAALPPDADLLLRAIADNQQVVEEGIAVFPASPTAYLYRDTCRPDGVRERILVRFGSTDPALFPKDL